LYEAGGKVIPPERNVGVVAKRPPVKKKKKWRKRGGRF